MKNILSVLILGSVLGASAAFAAGDDVALAKRTVQVAGPSASQAVTVVTGNLKSIFDNYQMPIDDSTTVLSPLAITGTPTQPVLKISLEKCEYFICEDLDLDAEISIQAVAATATCAQNYVITADLSRSSALLAQTYDHFNVNLCFAPAADGSGVLNLVATAHKAPQYEDGTTQGQILDMLKQQIDPIVKALKTTLAAPVPAPAN